MPLDFISLDHLLLGMFVPSQTPLEETTFSFACDINWRQLLDSPFSSRTPAGAPSLCEFMCAIPVMSRGLDSLASFCPSPARTLFLTPLPLGSLSSEVRDSMETSRLGPSVPRCHFLCNVWVWVPVCAPICCRRRLSLVMAAHDLWAQQNVTRSHLTATFFLS